VSETNTLFCQKPNRPTAQIMQLRAQPHVATVAVARLHAKEGMPTAKRRRAARVDKRDALNKRLVKIQAELTRLRSDREVVRRGEFVEMTKSLHQLQRNTDDLEKLTKDLAMQFTRIAQLQVEVDVIKRALVKAKWLD